MAGLLERRALNALVGKKNLLAFSGGVDSSALFFLLLQEGIEFDIAIVDYEIREQSKQEVAYAKELAKMHNMQIYVATAPQINTSFEKNARDFRYLFFENIIIQNQYNNLITAHQLNDRLEWFLMRLVQGSGINELVGMQSVDTRQSYNIIRPLLKLSRDEILNFLQQNNIKYFEDESNLDEKYTRNSFRKKYTSPLIFEFSSGIKKSFEILECEISKYEYLEDGKFAIFLNGIDKLLKKRGYLLSGAQREQAKTPCVIASKWSIDYDKNGIGFLAPYSCAIMDKNFKEKCRLADIPPKIRAYIYESEMSLEKIISLRNKLLQQS